MSELISDDLETIYQHVTDPSVKLDTGQTLKNKRFIQYGSRFGRIIFTAGEIVHVLPDAKWVTIENCDFRPAN